MPHYAGINTFMKAPYLEDVNQVGNYDVAIVGVPAEYFTIFGVDIKRRSPFANTVVVELANDWIGYLPNLEAHELGGYQTWMGLHSYAEPGEYVVVVKVIDILGNDTTKTVKVRVR